MGSPKSQKAFWGRGAASERLRDTSCGIPKIANFAATSGSKLLGIEGVSLTVVPPFLCAVKEMGVRIK